MSTSKAPPTWGSDTSSPSAQWGICPLIKQMVGPCLLRSCRAERAHFPYGAVGVNRPTSRLHQTSIRSARFGGGVDPRLFLADRMMVSINRHVRSHPLLHRDRSGLPEKLTGGPDRSINVKRALSADFSTLQQQRQP